MHEIRRLLRGAAWRMGLTAFCRAFVVALAGALAGLIVLRLVQQLWPIQSELPWVTIAMYTAIAAVVGALGWTIFTRANAKTVARQVDEGGQLKESISTALCCAGTDEPWARVVVESAVERVRGVKLREAVPITPPRFWPVPLALALTMLVVWLAVQQRTTAEMVAEKEQDAKIVEAKTQAKEAEAKIDEIASQLKLDEALKDADKPDATIPEPKTPEEIRVSAIKKLSALNDRLEQLRQGEEGQKSDSVQDALKQLRTPGEGPLQEMSKELAKGNFQKASEEMTKALEKLQKGEMSEKDMEKMAEQLKKLAEQLNKIAEDSKALEKELEKAGLNKELAKDPEALKKALENAKNLTEEQKQQLQQQCQSKKESSDMCKNMSKCMSGMCSNMSKEGMNPKGMSASQEFSKQLSQMEQLAEQMKMAESALNECKSQLQSLASQCKSGQCKGMGECQGGDPNKAGDYKTGWSQKRGKGSGGPGYGEGGSRPDAKADFKAKDEKFKSNLQNGPIIGSQLVDGEQVRGESTQQLAAALETASQNADDAIENNRVPREYQEAVKNLYGKLKKKAEAAKAGGGAKEDAKEGSSEEKKEEKKDEKK